MGHERKGRENKEDRNIGEGRRRRNRCGRGNPPIRGEP